MLPPQALAAERMFQVPESKLLGVVCELRVPDALAEGPCTAAALAPRLAVDADALDRVLRFVASRGWLDRRRDGAYALNKRSQPLRGDHPDSVRDFVRFMAADWTWEMWNRVGDAVRDGGSAAEAATGKPFFSWLNEDRPDAGELFNGAMQSLSALGGPLFADAVDLDGVASICDVGGGTGRTLGALLVKQPGARGVLYDMPGVIAGAAAVLDPLVPGRWEAVAGDFFEGVPVGHDRYVLQAIMHDWDDERCRRILGHIRGAMAPDGRVLVMDQRLEPEARDDVAKAVDVLMLALADGGRERTQAEWEALVASAGFRIERQVQLPILTWVFTLAPV
jgi:multifunctional cyclase/dehydratase/O-methyltransferase